MTTTTCRRRSTSRSPGAFTLIEVLVTLGIIVILMAFAFPMIGRAIYNAKRVRIQGDMGVIVTALEEYKKDHNGRYPGSEGTNTGFAVLARELVGVYGDGLLPGPPPQQPDPNDPPPYVSTNPYKAGDAVQVSNVTYVCMFDITRAAKTGIAPGGANNAVWAQVRANDGADGPGTTITGQPGSKKVAYIPPDRLHVRGCAILDQVDDPILYFPARGRPNIKQAVNNGASFMALGVAGAKFDANDNIQFFVRNMPTDAANSTVGALKRIQCMLGDFDIGAGTGGTSFDGIINGSENAAFDGAYLLWSGGPDGLYGPNISEADFTSDAGKIKQAIIKCDDIILTP